MNKAYIIKILNGKLNSVQSWDIPNDLDSKLIGISEFHFHLNNYFNFVGQVFSIPELELYYFKLTNELYSYDWIERFLKETDAKGNENTRFEHFAFGTYKTTRGKTIKKERVYDLKKLVKEAKKIAKTLNEEALHFLRIIQKEDIGTKTHRQKEFKKLNTEKGDLLFGDNYSISQDGHIYNSKGQLLKKVGKAGFYLLKTLTSSNGGQTLGKKDFKPLNENSKFEWKYIKKIKSKIKKSCGEVIGTNTKNEYYYSYRTE